MYTIKEIEEIILSIPDNELYVLPLFGTNGLYDLKMKIIDKIRNAHTTNNNIVE